MRSLFTWEIWGLFYKAGILAFCFSTALMGAAPFIATDGGGVSVKVAAWEGESLDLEAIEGLSLIEIARHPQGKRIRTLRYLAEAITRMTGIAPRIEEGDFSSGIVLVTLEDAPGELKADPAILRALEADEGDPYSANEAYYIRSEPERVVVVANTGAGLMDGVVGLLESVGYEVLGMGPHWTHVPDYRSEPLVFDLEKADRPDFYIRNLWATSGQERGVGTLRHVPPDPADEPVGFSYERWRVGTRMASHSMPNFPGHALHRYHAAILDHMRATGIREGFLVPDMHVGPSSKRPAASEANQGDLWVDNSPQGAAFVSNGKEWVEYSPGRLPARLDLSVPTVRKLILEDMKRKAEKHFEEKPDALFIFGTDPEDGGYGALDARARYPDWYSEYLAGEGIDFGRAYVLNGFLDLNQPKELWDPTAVSDTIFGFNNWLLREFDKWVDSLPEERRRSVTGKSLKDGVRCSLYSYNFHDVPPNFNLDPRIRVMIAGFPKHRGRGKWRNFRSSTDIASAFRLLLPKEPSGIYRILSSARYGDRGMQGIRAIIPAEQIQAEVRSLYEAGFRAFSGETDFNFGRMGLTYYLYAKMLWNFRLSSGEVAALRDRWLQRSFGSGWKAMREYYDFMEPDHFGVSAPRNWGKAIRLLDAADQAIDPENEPAAQKRIDDLKQYWYYYYLVDTGQTNPPSEALREFAWKGQTSYMTAMYMVGSVHFRSRDAAATAGPDFNNGPAHYSHEETQDWWEKIKAYWPVVEVSNFADMQLADGTKAGNVDLNDLVGVVEFQEEQPKEFPFRYNAGSSRQDVEFLTTAAEEGTEIGFRLFWPWDSQRRFYQARDVFYGVCWWNARDRQWDELIDITSTFETSRKIGFPGGKDYQMAEVRFDAPHPGTYRITVSQGGDGASLASLDWSPENANPPASSGLTYFENLKGSTQSGVWFYLPRGTRSLDLETWDIHGGKTIHLHKGLPGSGMTHARSVDVSRRGTHKIALEEGEDGSLVLLEANGFAFPYLYSIPSLWAKSPSALLVPRSIARADGLTTQ